MTAIAIMATAQRNELNLASTVPQTEQAVGGVQTLHMSQQDIQDALSKVHGETQDGLQNGTRVHIHYESFGRSTPEAIKHALRAAELGLERNRYTGRVHRVWTSAAGDQCITLWVELERDHMYRTLNLVRGKVYRFVILGE
jgi:hypothetical protein